MRRKLLNSIAITAVVAATSVPAPLVPAAVAESRVEQGFCRTAAPLPDIGREPDWQAEQDRRNRAVARTERSGDDAIVADETAPLPPLSVAPAPPPPPSAAPAPPPVASGGADDDGTALISVTARRIDSPVLELPSPITAISSEELGGGGGDAAADVIVTGSRTDGRRSAPLFPRVPNRARSPGC
jgi:hypothetical protein